MAHAHPSLSGGLGNAAKVCLRRLASMLSEKWDFSIQYNSCLDGMYTLFHPPPIFNSVLSRGPFIPWMLPKTMPPTVRPDCLRGQYPSTQCLKSLPSISCILNLFKLDNLYYFLYFKNFFSVSSPRKKKVTCHTLPLRTCYREVYGNIAQEENG